MESVKKRLVKRAQHKMEYERRVNERQNQTTEEKTDTSNALDASSVIIESMGNESKKEQEDYMQQSGHLAYEQPEFNNEGKGIDQMFETMSCKSPLPA
ncbi:hypothetical protein Tco_0939109 [Tanacetum coccineum]|uniref:Uncharacterized protein n=1 Tax=Tanacetum coccineum TaxID=301880 RepID=A0ABQ5DJU8_9ASTR